MRSPKTRFLSLFFVSLLLGLSSCGQWWESFRRDPIAGLTRGVGGISVAVSLAQTAFNAYMNMNPSADPALRNQFNSIVARIQDGVATAQAALDTAAQLQQPQPDVDALFASAKNTVLSLAAFLRGLRQPPGSAVDPSMASAIAHCDAVGHAHY